MAGHRLPVQRSTDAFHDAVHWFLAKVADQLPASMREVTVAIELVPSSLDLATFGDRVPLWRLGPGRTKEITLFRRPIENRAQHVGLDEAVRDALTSALSTALGLPASRIDQTRSGGN